MEVLDIFIWFFSVIGLFLGFFWDVLKFMFGLFWKNQIYPPNYVLSVTEILLGERSGLECGIM